jgi:hypothetical protein
MKVFIKSIEITNGDTGVVTEVKIAKIYIANIPQANNLLLETIDYNYFIEYSEDSFDKIELIDELISANGFKMSANVLFYNRDLIVIASQNIPNINPIYTIDIDDLAHGIEGRSFEYNESKLENVLNNDE